jgi:hypothetical protein
MEENRELEKNVKHFDYDRTVAQDDTHYLTLLLLSPEG